MPHLASHGIDKRVALELSYMQGEPSQAQGSLWHALVLAAPEMTPLREWLKAPAEDRDAERRRHGCKQEDVKQLGCLHFFWRLAGEDQPLAAKLLEAFKTERGAPAGLREKIESFYARSLFSEKCPFSAALVRELHNKNSESETALLSGILIGLNSEALDKSSDAAHLARRFFNGAPKEIQDLQPAPMPRRLVKFLLERAKQHESWSEARHERVIARENAKRARSEKAAAEAAFCQKELQLKERENERLQRIYAAAKSPAGQPPADREGKKETVRINLPPRPAGPRISLPPKPGAATIELPPRQKETVRINLPPRPADIDLFKQQPAVNFTRTIDVALREYRCGEQEKIADAARKEALELQLADPAAFKEAKDVWLRRIQETEQRGFTLKISKKDAEVFCRLNVFPVEWFTSTSVGPVLLAIPPGQISFDERGPGAAWFRIGPQRKAIYESANDNFAVFRALQEAIEQYDWPHVKRIP